MVKYLEIERSCPFLLFVNLDIIEMTYSPFALIKFYVGKHVINQ